MDFVSQKGVDLLHPIIDICIYIVFILRYLTWFTEKMITAFRNETLLERRSKVSTLSQ